MSTSHRLRDRLVLALFPALVAYVIVLVGLMWMESRLIYFPAAHHVALPEHYGLKAEELWLRADDGVRLHGWYIRGIGERALVWFHGNAGNVSHRLENAKRLVDWFGLDIVLVDYRGYGRSEGVPSEAGLYADGRAMYQAARDRGFAPERIVLLGRSLGAAVALEVALDHACAGVVLETPFLSVPALARVHYPIVPTFLVRTQFDSGRKIARLRVPKLIVQAERDEIVPIAHSERLFDLAPEPKRFYVLPGATHNAIYDMSDPGYVAAWRSFLASLPGAAPHDGLVAR
ncbi:MAG: alpha/beta hydrolase [Chloroflexi bacterium]|nr:alpha/beta hydrolase [Chloroflexota bacterium]